MKITYWEAEYGMLELIPIENNKLFISKENQFVEVEKDYKENFISIRERKIKADSFKNILSEKLTECEVYYLSDYGKTSLASSTNGYAISSDAVIYFYTDGEYVTEIWLKLDMNQQYEGDVMFNLITEIIARHNLIFIDWGWKNIFTSRDRDSLLTYFAERISVFKESETDNQIKKTKTKSWLRNIFNW